MPKTLSFFNAVTNSTSGNQYAGANPKNYAATFPTASPLNVGQIVSQADPTAYYMCAAAAVAPLSHLTPLRAPPLPLLPLPAARRRVVRRSHR